MNCQSRAELLAAIAELCERYSNWRFGQLIANVSGWADREIWDVADEQLLEAACLHLEQLSSEKKQTTA
jgi:hypothetical protein